MSLESNIRQVRSLFLEKARVVNRSEAFIDATAFNKEIDPEIARLVIACWSEYFGQVPFEAIVGLPDSGSRWSLPLALKMDALSLPTTRKKVSPDYWPNMASYRNESFTGKRVMESHIGYVNPGRQILMVDDVGAFGFTAMAAQRAIKENGAEPVGLGLIFDKDIDGTDQHGVEEIRRTTDLDVFSIVTIKALLESEGGSIISLANEMPVLPVVLARNGNGRVRSNHD